MELFLPLHKIKVPQIWKFTMEQNKDIKPTHPGTLIKAELKARHVSQKEFAENMGVLPSRVSEIINGNRRISTEFALGVEDWLGISATTLLSMQSAFDIMNKHQDKASVKEIAATAWLDELDKVVSVKTLLKDFQDKPSSPVEKKDYLQKHYSIDNANSIRSSFANLAAGCFRKSSKNGLDERMISTWVVKARAEAVKEKPQGKLDLSQPSTLCKQLCAIFHENIDTKRRVKHTLNSCGIGLAEVAKVDRASIDGYSFIDDSTPYIVVTCRYDRIDNYAFTIMHELGHILLKHTTAAQPRINIDLRSVDEDYEDPQEQAANHFAAAMLIPDSVWKMAPAVPINPYTIQKRYTEWAENRHLNKWIVFGRMSYETGFYRIKSDSTRSINVQERRVL